ncbi:MULTISPECIES: S8 family serine peptidase [Salinibaculum]|uniref:S8 family serine peptidase n=1 Tax=Salinibaculum TaxID=2732368 RepID=UPI0030CAD0A0
MLRESNREDLSISRRQVLQAAGALGAVGGLSGFASAAGTAEFNVGVAAGARGAERAAKRAADAVRKTIDLGPYGRVVVGQFAPEARANLQNNPNVEYVEPNYAAEKLETLPWGVDRVDADVLHDNGDTGAGATIAILDTGVDDDHPDLAANVDPNLGAAFGSACGSESGGCRYGREGYNGNDCNYEWSDDDDHGTHVAGTASAVRGNSEGVAGGVSTEATIMPVKVLSGCGSGTYADIADGVKYAADNGADVVNMSLGGGSSDSTLRNACKYASDNGVVLVAAAGNDGPCSDCVSYPASYDTVMAVSATDSDDSLADYSSTGSEVELAAPGTGILSTIPPESEDDSNDGYERFSGTSMATPHVAGAAGQVAASGSLSNAEIRQQLTDSAEDVGLAANEQGAGLLDAEAAVGSSSSDSAPGVSWVTPSDGGTVSGTVTVQIDASDAENDPGTLNVDWILGSSSRVTTYSSDSGYYEDSWDSTAVSDGSYDLTAEATDSAGNTTTATITVTVDNTESAPAVDSLSASEVETSDGDAEFDADWSVSDSDGNLSSVDLVLTQDSDGSTEDTATVSVSGDTASGTTRLVAAGDEGTGNSYTVDATVTDGAGKTDSVTASAAESESAPAVDSLSASEVETSDSDAEFDVSWGVSDADGDLSSVELSLTDDTDSENEDSVTVTVSGDTASGTTRLVAAGDEGSGNSYTVEATVTDSYENTGSRSTAVSETESTNAAPSASIDALNNRSNPRWDRYEVDWRAGDADGNLDTVVVEMLDSAGNVLDSVTRNVSGSAASGVDEVRSKQTGATVAVTVTDTDGASDSDSRSI